MTAMAVAARPSLRRDPAHGIVGGVCAGMGRRLGVDPLVLRLVFLVATVAGGVGFLAYLLAWVAMPADEGTPRFAAAPAPRWRPDPGCSSSPAC